VVVQDLHVFSYQNVFSKKKKKIQNKSQQLHTVFAQCSAG